MREIGSSYDCCVGVLSQQVQANGVGQFVCCRPGPQLCMAGKRASTCGACDIAHALCTAAGSGYGCADSSASATATSEAVASAVAEAFASATNNCSAALAAVKANDTQRAVATAIATASASACSTGKLAPAVARTFIVDN